MSRLVKYSVAVASESLGDYAPVPLQGDLAACFKTAAELGFDSVEYHVRDPEAIDRKALKKLAKSSGVAVSAFGTGLEYSKNGNCLTSPDPACRKRMADKLRTYIDLAQEFDSVVFIGLLRGKSPTYAEKDAYLDLFAEELRPIAAYAAERKVVLGLEPIVFYLTNLLTRTRETIDFLALKGLSDVKLLLDTHHMFIEDHEPIGDAFRAAAGLTAHVHISDSDRRYPGSGQVDYAAVADALTGTGYSGAVSLEIVPYPNGVQAARYGVEWMRRVWGR